MAAKFEKFLISPDFPINFRKIRQVSKNYLKCSKSYGQKPVWLLSYVIVDGFYCLSNRAKIHVLMFWIFREKVCFTEAHYFIKSGKLKDSL